MTLNLKAFPVQEIVGKAQKLVEENPVAFGLSAAATLLTGYWIFRKAELRRDGKEYSSQISGSMRLLNNTDHTLSGSQFNESITDYQDMFAGARKETGAISAEESVDVRRARYAAMIDHFYNLVTDFYEWGWCQSFHFGPRFHNETFLESIKRAEYYLACRLGLGQFQNPKKPLKALDVGCGVGGPMRNIAVFTGAQVEGVTINEYQVRIGNKYNEANGLSGQCLIKKGDFQKLEESFAPESFDVAYAIEATCHSPDRVRCFRGVYNSLKKGGLFCVLEWVMLPGYDPKNKEHVRIKEGIEVGNGLPTLVTPDKVIKSFEDAGFEVIDHFDLNRGQHAVNEIAWYSTLGGSMSLAGFRMTWLGRMVTHSMVWTLELLHIAPSGSTKVSSLLNATALDLVSGGKEQIFTPSYFVLARKK